MSSGVLPPSTIRAVNITRRRISEYQYYELQAIDRRLTAAEMRQLHAFSTRARITAASVVNDYQGGSFKGNEWAWMEKYFDAFLYFAYWGTHTVELALLSRLLDRKTVRRYCCRESASVRERNGKTILTFNSEDDEPDDAREPGSNRVFEETPDMPTLPDRDRSSATCRSNRRHVSVNALASSRQPAVFRLSNRHA